MKNPSCLLALVSLLSGFARGDEFQDVSAAFGNTLTLAGVHHATTSNPDGTAINFWTPASEGAAAVMVGLSNPHMASADAVGNIYIADKASEAVLIVATNGLIRTFAGTHVGGFNGDGPAPATNLQISRVNGLYALPNGTVYLLDPGNHRIRRVGTNGIMTTIVNDPDPKWAPSGRALWVSPDETLIYYTHEQPAVPPSSIADGAVVKRWTTTNGIETVCSKSVGFRNPGNLDVNPVDGKLYVCDRAEEDSTKMADGLFRIDGTDQRTRVTGNATQPAAADGQSALNSFIEGPRGVAFLPNGSYFLAGHKDGNVWFVDTAGVIHKYLRGKGSGDGYVLKDGKHPPLIAKDYFAQPRSVTITPNGDLLVVCNDSGFLFRVDNLSAPTITAGPIIPAAYFGSNTTLSVTVTSAGTLHYQWLKDGVPVPGGTNATLRLTNLGASDLGTYAVTVSNAKGSATSGGAVLAILPAITQQPQPAAALAGSPATFTVAAVGVNTLTYQWYREPSTLIPGATGVSLTLAHVSVADAGNYFVRVTSPLNGSVDSLHVALSLGAPPVITTQPANQTVGLGQTATFTVGVNGAAPLAYQWFVDGTELPGETDAVLGVFRAESADAGQYHVVITNLLGAATSAVATLTVLVPTNAPKPTVAITVPAAALARVTSNTLNIAGTAASSVGVDDVFVRLGAQLVTIQGLSNSLKWAATVSLAPGTNLITATVVDLLGRSATNTKTVYRVATDALTLNVNPPGAGTVRGAADHQSLEVGKGYMLTAVPSAGYAFSNWSGGVSASTAVLNFLMQSNLTLTANFITNPFPAWAGNYNGLYLGPDDARHEHRGFFTALVRSDGGYSGKLQNGLKSFPLTGRFDVEGRSTNVVKRPGTNALALELALDLHGANTITGRVAASDWTANLLTDRAVFSRANPASFTNKYTLLIPGGTDDEERPGGQGFGSAAIDALGKLKFTGVLADGTPVTQAVPVSSGGDWPFYLPLNGGKGSIIGWVAFTNSVRPDLGGTVNWFRPALASGKFYTNGFSLDSSLVGSAYAPPGTNRLVNLDTAVVTFTDDDLHGFPTNTIAFGPSGRITNTGPNKLVLTATPATGWLKGSFTIPGTNSVIPFKGIILQKQRYGGGFHLGPEEPGGFYIGP